VKFKAALELDAAEKAVEEGYKCFIGIIPKIHEPDTARQAIALMAH